MSVEHLSIVLHHSKAKGTAKLVLLGIANHAGDGGAWPSVGTLATYANAEPRTVQRAIQKLIGSGELRVAVQAGGLADWDDYTRPNRYDVLLACPPWCDRTANHRDTRSRQDRLWKNPVTPTSGGDTSVTGGGDTSVTQTVLDNPVAQVPASTTDRARPSRAHETGCDLDLGHAGACRVPALPPSTPPPVETLAEVRERLKRASQEHRRNAEEN